MLFIFTQDILDVLVKVVWSILSLLIQKRVIYYSKSGLPRAAVCARESRVLRPVYEQLLT
jgi:hypothetical protein